MVGVGEGGEGWGSWSFRLAFRRVLALLRLFWMCARMAGVSAGMALVLSGLGCVLVVRSIRGYGGLGGRAGRGEVGGEQGGSPLESSVSSVSWGGWALGGVLVVEDTGEGQEK